MTYKIKNTIVVFAFVAMLMAMPLATNAFATSGGNGIINPSCGITEPSSINMGTVTRGAQPAHVLTEIVTTGTVVGTFEVKINDWVSGGAKAENSMLLDDVKVNDVLTINGLTYTAAASGTAEGTFDQSGSDIADATALASQIVADTRTGVTESTVDVQAVSFDNAVFARSNIIGSTIPNNVDIAQTTGTNTFNVQVAGGKLTGGEAAGTIVHMEAADTHWAVTTDESGNAQTYAQKSALHASTVNKVLSTTTDPDPLKDIFFWLHLTGVDDPATATITALAGLVDPETVVINGVTFTAEDTLPLDALDFDATGNTVADITALRAAILLNADPKYTVGAVVGESITLTAVKPGAEANGITLTQGADGFTLTGSGFFSGGDDALDNLPFTGGITNVVTFGTRC